VGPACKEEERKENEKEKEKEERKGCYGFACWAANPGQAR
jgi:hypothetical protein